MAEDGRPSKYQPIADLLLGLSDQDEEERDNPDLILTDRRLEALDLWSRNPWDFLTGKDPDTGLPIIRTVDELSLIHI